ncbi:hypothetical protein SSCG_04994 [Streptomyces clavuligerus]|nr:hypothetical protein SSCG_04994 [Streptomyces clavuligerus]
MLRLFCSAASPFFFLLFFFNKNISIFYNKKSFFGSVLVFL